MPVRRVARFRPQRNEEGRPSGFSILMTKGLLRLLDLVAVCIAILLVAAPIAWRKTKANDAIDRWVKPRNGAIDLLEKDWMTMPRPPAFTQGDEPAVKAFLEAQPLVLALQDRQGQRPLWIRKDGILVRAGDGPMDRPLRKWLGEAEREQVFVWFPEGNLPDEDRADPKVIMQGDRWQVLKRWKEGSPEVERFLRSFAAQGPPFRIALAHEGDEARTDLKPQAWGQEPNLQGDPYRGLNSIFSTQMVSNEFPGWRFYIIPFHEEALAIQHAWRVQFRLAIAFSVAVGLALVLALYLRSRARRKAALDADRMASMTHSLKTPLAILKFRCDTLRLGRLSPDQLDAQLIQIGEEADRMSLIIESALAAIQGSSDAGPQATVTPAWIAGIAEDLAPAFEAVGRRLVVACTDQTGVAALASLRAGLFTLVENALFHGKGTVTVTTLRVRKRLLIKVCDEGEGLGSVEMKTLGRPFMRIRDTGREGFRKEGQGLGLSLLTKVVEREGWGLTFASESGRGLCVTLEIQAL